jgi:hypothetical protein
VIVRIRTLFIGVGECPSLWVTNLERKHTERNEITITNNSRCAQQLVTPKNHKKCNCRLLTKE